MPAKRSTLPPNSTPQPGQLYIGYVPLSKAQRWRGNPRDYELDEICQSIETHGFRDAPIWDGQLNDGEGGTAGGNRRISALIALKAKGSPPPRFIGQDDAGEWYLPMQFGGDAESQEAAAAFAIDHNNITLQGFDAQERMRIWRAQDYVDLINSLDRSDSLPVSVSRDDLAALLEATSVPDAQAADVEATKRNLGDRSKQIKPVLYMDDLKVFELAMRKTGLANRGKAIALICQFYLDHTAPTTSNAPEDGSNLLKELL